MPGPRPCPALAPAEQEGKRPCLPLWPLCARQGVGEGTRQQMSVTLFLRKNHKHRTTTSLRKGLPSRGLPVLDVWCRTRRSGPERAEHWTCPAPAFWTQTVRPPHRAGGPTPRPWGCCHRGWSPAQVWATATPGCPTAGAAGDAGGHGQSRWPTTEASRAACSSLDPQSAALPAQFDLRGGWVALVYDSAPGGSQQNPRTLTLS